VFSGTVLRLDPERRVGEIAVDGSGHEVTVRSSDIDGGVRQSPCPPDRVRRTVHSGPLGAPTARVWTP
jgi:hypothetical protein